MNASIICKVYGDKQVAFVFFALTPDKLKEWKTLAIPPKVRRSYI